MSQNIVATFGTQDSSDSARHGFDKYLVDFQKYPVPGVYSQVLLNYVGAIRQFVFCRQICHTLQIIMLCRSASLISTFSDEAWTSNTVSFTRRFTVLQPFSIDAHFSEMLAPRRWTITSCPLSKLLTPMDFPTSGMYGR